MRAWLAIFLLSIFAVGCAPKSGENAEFTGEIGLGAVEDPVIIPPSPPKNSGTSIKISCDPNPSFDPRAGILLLESNSLPQAESFLPINDFDSQAGVAALLLRSTASQNLFAVNTGANLFLSKIDFESGLEISRSPLGKAPGLKEASKALSALGYGKPRVYTSSPDNSKFLVGSGSSYFLRSTEEPTKDVTKWKISPNTYFNPRWENGINASSDLIFFDSVQDGKIRQAFVRLNKGKFVEIVQLDALSSDSQQLGVKRFDKENLIWMEWKKEKAIIRLMNIFSRKVFSMKVPEVSKFGAAFGVIHEDRVGNLLAIPSLEGIHFFRLNQGAVEESHFLSFSEKMKEAMATTKAKPIVFSAADDTQLFAQISDLSTKGAEPMIFALEHAKRFRKLGKSGCVNPGFYEEVL